MSKKINILCWRFKKKVFFPYKRVKRFLKNIKLLMKYLNLPFYNFLKKIIKLENKNRT